ncbi:hypothetical protein NQ315_011469 [Exocentrus adspersus]|uniref:Cyclic nucleotide-binding domain-containing protein n=1 Tax=Exocentrus adspersus TaxID=1586481 RepID=A0AAV8VUD5_9CUCU|nr:hypothetical protein NQ315_011469 [Exocentrus adspersus]
MTQQYYVREEGELLGRLQWYVRWRLLSADNPLRLSCFRSNMSVRQEQIRQLRESNLVIHPFSKFRVWYQVYLVFLYGSVLGLKPFNAAFTRSVDYDTVSFFQMYITFLDLLCWIDILVNFCTGFEIQEKKMIELRIWYISKHYMFGPYFICDVMSSIPSAIMYSYEKHERQQSLHGILYILGMFKTVRYVSLITCLWRTAEYYNLMPKLGLFVACTVLTSFFIVHWMTCMQFAIPRLVKRFFREKSDRRSWIFQGNLFEKPLKQRYTHCFFRSSAQILGVNLYIYKMELPEEYVVTILTFFIGKVVVAFLWVILAVAIINSRYMNIKFSGLINQLEAYMIQKKLPTSLRSRIYQYFFYKYQNKYFKEEHINSLLSDNLKNEMTLHICQSLIKKVNLFSEMTSKEVKAIVDYLVPVIFLPNDVIIQSGTHPDAMFFINTGTVAVYTQSGKEFCHLQDGAFFGETDLILKSRFRKVTIIAVETSHLYRLDKIDFEKRLIANKKIMAKMVKNAEHQLRKILQVEEKYKAELFGAAFAVSTDNVSK